VSRRCPSCRQPVGDRGVNPAFPFCSERCRLLDLGKWFDGQYRVPGERAGDGAAGPGAEDGEPTGRGRPPDDG
jgi:endogenous inhibitor of DNA gyrase (YacG/DUF329 family)